MTLGVSAKERLKAVKQAAAVDTSSRKGVIETARMLDRTRRKFIAAYKRNETLEIRQEFLKLHETLRDSMLHAHLLSVANNRDIQLSTVYTQAINNLERLLDLPSLSELQLQYDTRALRILNDASDKAELALRNTVNSLVASGSTTRDAVKQLNKAFSALGITPSNTFQIESIYRTQVQLAFSAGQWQALQDPVAQEILWGYKYVSVGDSRVRPEHEALDGTQLPKEHPLWQTIWPPNGWSCRCQVIPIFEERKEKLPPAEYEGKPVKPDEGFNFNPGILFTAA